MDAPAARPLPRPVDWGRTRYDEAERRQIELLEERLAGRSGDLLVFTEHEPVFTLGVRAGAEGHLLWDVDRRAREGVALASTHRGGDVTYHGPGQLVVYPIVSLEPRRDLHAYLRFLEDCLIATAAHFGVSAARRDGLTGIWVQRRKLAAIGIAVRRWVAFHGVALNVDPDLSHFGGIVPCGIATDTGTVTSLAQELPETPALADVGRVFAHEFLARWPAYLAGSASSAD
jgi:lipoyl(octanoyl) transferase